MPSFTVSMSLCHDVYTHPTANIMTPARSVLTEKSIWADLAWLTVYQGTMHDREDIGLTTPGIPGTIRPDNQGYSDTA